ncbi:hypothetical protein [Priestia abyssalis]|uniref:hypothetical protein n=1 Tax=Priestia abyssalis TaxID=1221450 RepID=UPI000995465B|nr:hypothetical protein [Priestia abyssalis]
MKNRYLYVAVLIFFLLGACGQQSFYKPSSINADFPVPEDARLQDGEAKNPKIEKYASYKWTKSNEIQSIPEAYLNEIERNGWKERKEEQMGALRVFEKNGNILWLTTHDDFFTLSQLKTE